MSKASLPQPVPSNHKRQPVPGSYQMVAMDLDGTLLRPDKSIGLRSVQAVHDAIRSGIRVVLATARPPRSVKKIYGVLRLDTVVINYNGALIQDPNSGKLLLHRALSPELAQRIVFLARKVDPKVVMSLEIQDKWFTDNESALSPSMREEAGGADATFQVGALEKFMVEPVTRIMMQAPPMDINRIRTALDKDLKGLFSLPTSMEHILQVMHSKVDKGDAVRFVADRYGIPMDKVVAIGDAPNDLSMLRLAGLGAAMDNAYDEVKEGADVVIPANDQDGVAFAIRKFVLKQDP